MSDNQVILLIDDEPDYISIRTEWLEEAGYQVAIVTTLNGAWEFIRDASENEKLMPWVLLDIMMPIVKDLEWAGGYDENKKYVSAPTAGLFFAEKLKDSYPGIKLAWHSVRSSLEPIVKKKMNALGFSVIQKDLQDKEKFLEEIKLGFKNEKQ